MDSAPPDSSQRSLLAYTVPMAAFLLFLAATALAKKIGGSVWLASAEYWIYPLQTIVCGGLLIGFWRRYESLRPRAVWLAILAGLFVFALWISPQQFFRQPARRVGFNPEMFIAWPVAYWFTIVLRFVRLVVVVPLVEEIFWRGFLLRYLIDEKFSRVPFGMFSWISFGAVTLGFTFVHSAPDWIAAFITGALYNCVAYRTKSLGSCVIAHATTNLLLGLWIVMTKQWGFW
ncbi:MAG: CAAX prenyl protease-related protein [Verrucomicrobiota bacterium]|nr:CAAX prenyl protease-related protein [Verrucomicrobiota bacterium]